MSGAHAAATSALAEALKPHQGLLFYRCYVSDADVDGGDPQADPAKAVYDQLRPLDGKLADNVVVQIKNGPVDFQVREAPSPLFGALEKTNQAIELQVTQEYVGQQRHVCYLVPMWKWILDFDMHAKADATPIKALVAGNTFGRPTGGFVAVVNVGRDANWLGHDLAMANLYGFGRLAWDPELAPKTTSAFGSKSDDLSNLAQETPPFIRQSIFHAKSKRDAHGGDDAFRANRATSICRGCTCDFCFHTVRAI